MQIEDRRSYSHEPLLMTIEDATKALGVSRNLIYDGLNAGALEKVKVGGRTMITVTSVKKVAKHGFRKEVA